MTLFIYLAETWDTMRYLAETWDTMSYLAETWDTMRYLAETWDTTWDTWDLRYCISHTCYLAHVYFSLNAHLLVNCVLTRRTSIVGPVAELLGICLKCYSMIKAFQSFSGTCRMFVWSPGGFRYARCEQCMVLGQHCVKLVYLVTCCWVIWFA